MKDRDMDLPTRGPNVVTERAGLNFVRAIVEGENCIFHQIHQQDDYGVDAFLELVDGPRVTGKCVAIQVKSGSSYCSVDECRIPYTARQARYWRSHSLPVLGIVFDPTEQSAYWIDLAARCSQVDCGSIAFTKSEYRRFDKDSFHAVLLPLLIDQRTPNLDFERAQAFARSMEPEVHQLGLRILLAHHSNTLATWLLFEELLLSRAEEDTDPFLVYALAHIPWHGDIAPRSGFSLSEDLRAQVRARMGTWTRQHVEKLVQYIDDNEIQRGTSGQSVYAIVDVTIPNADHILEVIVDDESWSERERQKALILYCFVAQENAEPLLRRYLADESLVGHTAKIAWKHLKGGGSFIY